MSNVSIGRKIKDTRLIYSDDTVVGKIVNLWKHNRECWTVFYELDSGFYRESDQTFFYYWAAKDYVQEVSECPV